MVQYIGQLFQVGFEVIQFGTGDQYRMVFYEVLVKASIGKGGAVRY